MSRPDLAVVGGGVIGLAVAWRAARRGLRTVVLEAGEPGRGATHVAAGMLAPVGEAEHGETALLRLGLRSLDAWPAFAAELEEETGIDPGFRRSGSLAVAVSGDEDAALRRHAAFLAALGLDAELLPPSACRELEPRLAPRLRLGLLASGDAQADPRAVTAALMAACRDAGVEIRHGARIRSLGEVDAGRVVVAAGEGTSELEDIEPALASALRPVKGQILQLRGPRPLVRHAIRLPTVYLVPRDDGRLVVGATVEERVDTTVTAGAVLELLRRAVEAVPDVAELELAESAAALRPGTRDNAPVLGELAPGGPIAAFGHYRNGILLAPATAEAVAAMAAGDPAPAWIEPFTPARFTAVGPRTHVDLAQR